MKKKIKISIDIFIKTTHSHDKRRPFKTSLYTIFLVRLFSQVAGSNTDMRFADVHRESATYSWPCEKTEDWRSKPTFLTDWPCDLFMVIANARRTGNCLRRSGIGRVSLEGVKEIRGIRTLFPENLWSPEITVQSNTRGLIWFKIIRVPLQRPLEGSKFRRSIIGHPGFKVSFARGNPLAVSEFRYSAGYGW